jgi:pantoate--beta-alanine ligase
MKVYTDLPTWRSARLGPDWSGRTIGFVPTMGALHAGHESLLARARAENERVVLSIFVNPPQFNDPADLANYPRTLEADLELASPYVDAVFSPPVEAMYADGYRFQVSENQLSTRWEGLQRPGHFEGVLTVVLKLLNLVQASRAYFGEKDWQQLQLVQGMVDAFFLPTEIVPCPTVRDPDGLALSSRNRRLSPAARARAAEFPRTLRTAPDAATAMDRLRTAGFEVDYVNDVEGERLGAIRLEGIRLIDHVRLDPPAGAPRTQSLEPKRNA